MYFCNFRHVSKIATPPARWQHCYRTPGSSAVTLLAFVHLFLKVLGADFIACLANTYCCINKGTWPQLKGVSSSTPGEQETLLTEFGHTLNTEHFQVVPQMTVI